MVTATAKPPKAHPKPVSKKLPKPMRFGKIINPKGDRVVVQVEKPASETPGGILLPDSSRADSNQQYGRVLKVGPGTWKDGKLIPVNVQEGDQVLFLKYAGSKIDDPLRPTLKFEEGEIIIMREEDIIASLTDPE